MTYFGRVNYFTPSQTLRKIEIQYILILSLAEHTFFQTPFKHLVLRDPFPFLFKTLSFVLGCFRDVGFPFNLFMCSFIFWWHFSFKNCIQRTRGKPGTLPDRRRIMTHPKQTLQIKPRWRLSQVNVFAF